MTALRTFFDTLFADLAPLGLPFVTVSTVLQTGHRMTCFRRQEPLPWTPRRTVLSMSAAMAGYYYTSL